MKKLLFFIVSLLVVNATFAQSDADKKKAYELGMEAIRLMDQDQKYEEAIEVLEKAQKLDPENIDYPYEIAYALYSMKEYKKTIKAISKLLNHKDVTPRHYQLLGNSHDILGDSEKAMETYKKGLKKFPKSGELYLELGVVEYLGENYNQAIDYWEKGVEVAPLFPSNYYWLGKIFAGSSEKIWSVMYGEIFMNLERNSRRTVEMSKILYNVYNESIHIKSDTEGSVDFSSTMTMNASSDGEIKIPFQMTYGINMNLSMGLHLVNGKEDQEDLSLSYLNKLRKTFIENWYQNEQHKDYPNILFEYQRKLIEAGHFETYNYWFLMQGRSDEFDDWYKENEDAFNNFAEWFKENWIPLSEENYFSRNKY